MSGALHIFRYLALTLSVWAVMTGCLTGCAQDTPTTGPQQSATLTMVERGFTPLAQGNRWRYDATFRLEFIPLNAGGLASTEIFHGTIEREIIGTEERFGREYILQESMFYAEARPDTAYQWHRFRQDGAGLYLADIPPSWPPDFEPPEDGVARRPASQRAAPLPNWSEIAGAIERPLSPHLRRAVNEHLRRLRQMNTRAVPGIEIALSHAIQNDGILPGETQRLAYPVLTGSEWVVREQPFDVRAVVEALEEVDLPMGPTPGYRIWIDNQLQGPEDTVLQWQSRCGWLGFFSHLETLAMDPLTGDIVLILTEQTEWLADLDINEGSCAPRN